MTSLQFRRDAELIKEARRVLDDPTLKLMLQIATDERPSRVQAKVPADMLHVQLGRTYGYEEALDAIRGLAIGIADPASPVPMDWNVHEED